MLQGHPKDLPLGTYRPGGLYPPPGLPTAGLPTCGLYPRSLDPLLRAPFGLYPPTALPTPGGLNPYIGYERVKMPTGAETLVPVCRDPTCKGCPLSASTNPLLSASAGRTPGACPAGCTTCDHQKSPIPSLPGLPPHSSASAQPGASTHPYVCSWFAGESYCGKRFATSEELLQHLRSHTSSSLDYEAHLLSNPLLSSAALASQAGLHRAYPGLPQLSDLRYHPYAKPPLPGSLTPLPPSTPLPSAFPPMHPSLASYYSPYSLYGQRLGPMVYP